MYTFSRKVIAGLLPVVKIFFSYAERSVQLGRSFEIYQRFVFEKKSYFWVVLFLFIDSICTTLTLLYRFFQ